MTGRALDALYEWEPPHRPLVTYGILGLCLLITIPTLIRPELYAVFGGVEPRRYPWQLFTAAFEHGWPGFHGSIHLALNAFLILECGRPCERLLGSPRFLALCLLSLGANAVAQLLVGGVNGSSLLIWAWGPPLFVALRAARRASPEVARDPVHGRLLAILLLIYVAIPLAMTLVPYAAGWRGNPVVGFLRANVFHLVATAVGAGFAAVHVGWIRRRLTAFGGPEPPPVDRPGARS